jgi:hypothetical protein
MLHIFTRTSKQEPVAEQAGYTVTWVETRDARTAVSCHYCVGWEAMFVHQWI